ncbi:hypothetical protein M413DRAFT_445450 [Hebeloma cylindrosporum]|uniref:Uncharacterized protein n=1 Tax=Hebeloma cylindrosporum TaxID=76867 RepID=A0A0C2XUW2_HEBCY|nr:hypothetical protein M413DRAFT_445450 [Hebeloma cylindrosporum h7]
MVRLFSALSSFPLLSYHILWVNLTSSPGLGCVLLIVPHFPSHSSKPADHAWSISNKRWC